MDALMEVYDPETGLDIVSMGLVYDVRMEGTTAMVKMTKAAPPITTHPRVCSVIALSPNLAKQCPK